MSVEASIAASLPQDAIRGEAAHSLGGMQWSGRTWLWAAGSVLGLAAIGALAFSLSGGQASRPETNVAAPARAATAGEPAKVNGQQPAWSVACTSSARAVAADCKIQQRLLVQETGRTLSLAVVDIPGDTRKPTLWLQLPNEIALQDGVSLAIDDGTQTPVPLQSCDGNGCYASLALSGAQIAAMENGKVMAIRLTAVNRQPLIFRHLLTDFAGAFKAAR